MSNDTPFDFDAENVRNPNVIVSRGPIPVTVVGAERKNAKNGDGEYLELTLKVEEGEHAGLRIFDRCILKHSNPQAMNIGRYRLATLCRAIGVLRPTDPEELLNYRAIAVVNVKPHRDTGEPQNEVSRYLPEGEPGVSAPAPAPARPAAAPPPNGAPAPWGTDPKAAATPPASPPVTTPGPDTYA